MKTPTIGDDDSHFYRSQCEMQEELDKSPQRIRRMFDAIAPWYDFLNRFFSLGIDRHWRQKAAKLVLTEETVSGPLLDVCCGTGDLSLALFRRSQRLAEERKVFGVDFSEKMIDIGRRKIADTPIELSVGDALNLPFEDAKFAAVVVAFGLRNVGDTQRGLAEMVRVCRSGGVVAVLEFSMPTLPILSHFYRFYFQCVLPRIGQCLAKNRDDAYRYLPESVMAFDSPDRLRQRMEELGLGEIRTKSMTFGIASLVWGRKC